VGGSRCAARGSRVVRVCCRGRGQRRLRSIPDEPSLGCSTDLALTEPERAAQLANTSLSSEGPKAVVIYTFGLPGFAGNKCSYAPIPGFASAAFNEMWQAASDPRLTVSCCDFDARGGVARHFDFHHSAAATLAATPGLGVLNAFLRSTLAVSGNCKGESIFNATKASPLAAG
jgi:hypothetical protein